MENFNAENFVKTQIKNLRGFLSLIKVMGINASYRRHFWQTLFYCLVRNRKAFRYGVVLSALYLHFGPFTEQAMINLDANMKNSYTKKDALRTATDILQNSEISSPTS